MAAVVLFWFSTLTSCSCRSGSALLGLIIAVQLLTRHLLFGHGGKFENKIDHLVFVDRCAKLGQRIRIVAIVVPDFLLAPGHLARAFDDGAADFVFGNRNLVLLADFRKYET